MFCTWHGPAWAWPSSSWQPGAEEQRAQFHPAALPGCCSARRQLPAPARAFPWVPGLPQPGARRVPCQTRLCPGSPDRKARGNVPCWSCWGCLRGTSLLSLLSAVQGKEGGVAPSHSTHLCLTHTGAGHRVPPAARAVLPPMGSGLAFQNARLIAHSQNWGQREMLQEIIFNSLRFALQS